MPIGPSHGSRGGGRSFGGGGRGFSFGGGRRHSSTAAVARNIVIGGLVYSIAEDRARRRFYSRYGYNPTPDEIRAMPHRSHPGNFLFWAIFFVVIAIITMGTRLSAYENKARLMKSEYDTYYSPLIENATEAGTNGYYKTIASFKNAADDVDVFNYYYSDPDEPGVYLDFERDDISYYFIVYEYTDARTGQTHTAMTYTQFSGSQYQALNGEIEIAYYSKAGAEHYSINTSYNVKECAEYKYYKSNSNKFLIAFIVELVIVALLTTLYVIKLKKYNKLVAEDDALLFQKRQAETQKAQAEAQEAQYDAQRKNRFCQYCGSQIDEHTNTCSSCGAKVSNN